jgi:hypothetical protein
LETFIDADNTALVNRNEYGLLVAPSPEKSRSCACWLAEAAEIGGLKGVSERRSYIH